MGGCCSLEAPIDPTHYPEEGKKLRRDVAVEEVYQLGEELGQGAFSEVRLATHRQSGRQYACKIIPLPDYGQALNEHQTSRSTIMKEIDALVDVDHDHVVPLHEYYRQGNRLYLIMELLRGGELLEALQEVGYYSEAAARTIFRQLIEAIQYLHSKGVVHRDVKLKNLLLAEPGDITHIKLADFGFARKLRGAADGMDIMQTVCGTPGFTAPEVIRGALQPNAWPPRLYGKACDLWSAGVVLFVLLSGVLPFDDPSEPRLLRSISAGQFEFADPAWEEVSEEAKDLVRKLLVVNPAKRLTCEQVLAHPWMTRPGVERELARTRSHFSESSVHGRNAAYRSLRERIDDALSGCGSPPGSAAGTLRGGSAAGAALTSGSAGPGSPPVGSPPAEALWAPASPTAPGAAPRACSPTR